MATAKGTLGSFSREEKLHGSFPVAGFYPVFAAPRAGSPGTLHGIQFDPRLRGKFSQRNSRLGRPVCIYLLNQHAVRGVSTSVGGGEGGEILVHRCRGKMSALK